MSIFCTLPTAKAFYGVPLSPASRFFVPERFCSEMLPDAQFSTYTIKIKEKEQTREKRANVIALGCNMIQEHRDEISSQEQVLEHKIAQMDARNLQLNASDVESLFGSKLIIKKREAHIRSLRSEIVVLRSEMEMLDKEIAALKNEQKKILDAFLVSDPKMSFDEFKSIYFR